MPRRAVLALLPALVLLSGCGATRTPVPQLAATAPPGPFRLLTYPHAGISLRVPRNWLVSPGQGSLLMVASSGPAVIDLWRYPGAATPPAGGAALAQAESALVAAARSRQPALRLLRWAPDTVGGRGAVVLDTLQRINGQARRLRSVHIYLPGEELVLEEYAPPAQFPAVDHAVLSPVRHSLRLVGAAPA